MLQNLCKRAIGAAFVAQIKRFSSVTLEPIAETAVSNVVDLPRNEKDWDDFTAAFLRNRIGMTPLQKLVMTTGSSVAALMDPKRYFPFRSHDMIACLGEVTGNTALRKIYRVMSESPEGSRILQQRPRITLRTIDFEGLRALPKETLGRNYIKFLDVNKVTPDSRMEVRFMDSPDLAYVMTRYRECHDLVHTILKMPTNMLGEVSVKWVEALNTGLPMCYGGAVFGAMRFRAKARQEYVERYLPWATSVGSKMKPLMNVFWEERWEQDINDLRKELKISLLE